MLDYREREVHFAKEKEQIGGVVQQTKTELMAVNGEKKRLEQELHAFKTRNCIFLSIKLYWFDLCIFF